MTSGMAVSGGAEGTDFSAAHLPQQQLLKREVALGIIREMVPSEDLIGLRFAPYKDIAADNFSFTIGAGSENGGMAPARSESAEAKLFQQDVFGGGRGEGQTIDWAIKSTYRASDVNTHRNYLKALEALQDGNYNASIGNAVAEFNEKVLADTAKRKRMLDLRINWLIMQSVIEARVIYNDGEIDFDVNWGRPAAQHRFAPKSGPYTTDQFNPVDDIKVIQKDARERYGVNITRALCSQEYLDTLWLSKFFYQFTGKPDATAADMPYLIPGWGPESAVAMIEARTGVRFEAYDAVYRTRPVGSTVTTNTRWLAKDEVLFYPDEAEINALDDTDLGFGRTFTSPHPAGNWTPGFYDWERDHGVDPWGYTRGNGIKAFPVFPHMNKTYLMKVALPA